MGSFDLSENIKRQDRRHLSKNANEIVQAVQRDPRLTFDEARLLAVQTEMARWGIDPTGMPCDPKAVTFGRRMSALAPAAQTTDHLDLEGHGTSTGNATSSAAAAVKRSYRLAWLK